MEAVLSLATRIDWALVWTQVKLIGTAVGILYLGAHASLGRPPSAAPRQKRNATGKRKARDDKRKHIEGLQRSDAILFPAMASVVLVTLYYLLQTHPELVNALLRWYIAALSLVSLGTMYSHGLQLMTGFLMPRCVRREDGFYVIGVAGEAVDDVTDASSESEAETKASDGSKNKPLSTRTGEPVVPTAFVPYSAKAGVSCQKTTGPIPLIPWLSEPWLWSLRRYLTHPWTLDMAYGRFHQKIRFPIQHVFGGIGAVLTVSLYHATNRTVFSNLIGLAGCYSSMLIISPTDFTTGVLILSGLFVYDIVMVFYT
jgi:minor histocompatibility antigen H13